MTFVLVEEHMKVEIGLHVNVLTARSALGHIPCSRVINRLSRGCLLDLNARPLHQLSRLENCGASDIWVYMRRFNRISTFFYWLLPSVCYFFPTSNFFPGALVLKCVSNSKLVHAVSYMYRRRHVEYYICRLYRRHVEGTTADFVY